MGDAFIARPLDRLHNGRVARLDQDGHVLVYEPNHPKAMGGGWVFEHRIIVERIFGRYLARHEAVHHINGIKDDNRQENLMLMDAIDHAKVSLRDYQNTLAEQLSELEEYKRRFGPLKK